MNFQQFATTGFGSRLWMTLARRLPTGAAHALARMVTGVLYRRKGASLYRILYANQAGVLGPEATPEQLDRAVKAVLAHAGMTNIDLMQVDARGEETVRRAVTWPPEFWANAAAATGSGRGVLICGCHLSNFNLAFLAYALEGFPVQTLSAAMTAPGFRLLSGLRARGVVEETPVDGPSLRQAITRLRNGGAVAIGVDWPYGAGDDEPIEFFGRPSLLPTGYIRLALSANALVLPLACRWFPETGYHAITAPLIEMERTGDRAADVHHNARRVLEVAERWISESPDQWLMYHPVWPADASLTSRTPETATTASATT